jgi:hypothetical protein
MKKSILTLIFAIFTLVVTANDIKIKGKVVGGELCNIVIMIIECSEWSYNEIDFRVNEFKIELRRGPEYRIMFITEHNSKILLIPKDTDIKRIYIQIDFETNHKCNSYEDIWRKDRLIRRRYSC